MVLFHGSNAPIEKPNLELSRKSLDFGAGFYTTTNMEQAVDFAGKVAVRKGQKSQFVSVYDCDIAAAGEVLDILRFPAADRSWLEFVHRNRRGIYAGKFHDLVIGPVANDDVFTTLIIYEQGILSTEQTLEALKTRKLYNQYVFKTDKALSFLKFRNTFIPGEKNGF